MMDSVFKSTRSLLAILAMVLLFVVVVGSFLGYSLPDAVLALVSMALSNIIMAYFSNRNTTPPPDSTTTSVTTTVVPAEAAKNPDNVPAVAQPLLADDQ